MRIAITGASSTGKTTLARILCAEMPEFSHVNVDARRLLTNLGERNVADMEEAAYQEFQLQYIDQKIKIEKDCPSFITERSFVDCCAYWDFHCSGNSYPIDNVRIRQLCKDWASRYDLHIYLPFGQVPFELDGFRNPNANYHVKIQSIILKLLKLWGLRYYDCSDVVLADRYFACREEIKRCKK